MTALNITYAGNSTTVDVPDGDRLDDADLRRVAVELVRAGIEAPGTNGLYVPDLPAAAFDDFMVDRFTVEGTLTVYLRPKVPFGGEDIKEVTDDLRVAAVTQVILDYGADAEYTGIYAPALARLIVEALGPLTPDHEPLASDWLPNLECPNGDTHDSHVWGAVGAEWRCPGVISTFPPIDPLQLTDTERVALSHTAHAEANRAHNPRYHQGLTRTERDRLEQRWREIADTLHPDPYGRRFVPPTAG